MSSAFSKLAPPLPIGSGTLRWPEVYAHTDPDTGKPGDRLAGHLARVADTAADSAAAAADPLRRIALTSALLHDAGKATPWFQAYLTGALPRSPHTHHSRPGGIIAWCVAREWPIEERAALLQVILRHHGSPRALPIRAWDELRLTLSDPKERSIVRDQLLSMDLVGLGGWLEGLSRRYQLHLSSLPTAADDVISCLNPGGALGARRLVKKHTQRALHNFVRDWTAYGILLADDRIDTATGGARFQRPSLPNTAVESFVARSFAPPEAGSLGALRAAISEKVLQRVLHSRNHRLFTLTAPTGSGKTLAALRATLALRSEATGTPPRIIYALPFTSIIDQNHAVLEAVLSPATAPSSELLLKHHHLSDPRYETEAGDEYEPDGAGRLLVESWRSEVVVTTFHQLLHTFLGGRSRYAVRAGAWLDAIVILDEVQAIPLRYWRPVGRLLRAISEALGTRFILMTATRPLILTGEDVTELLPDHDEVFARLDRVDLDISLPAAGTAPRWTLAQAVLDTLEAKQEGSVLLVLNTRRAVRMAWHALSAQLGECAVIALSTDLTPRDRRAIIERCGRRLSAGEALVVVSTQMIEAGVDLSFQTVIRDFAPLDSVIQAAGRCNRHGASERGRVMLRQMAPVGRAGRPPALQVYDGLLLDVTREAIELTAGSLETTLPERRFLELSQRYFQLCQSRGESSDVDQLAAGGDYKELRRQFQLIQEFPSQAWFVEQDAEARRLWGMWQRCRPGTPRRALTTRDIKARQDFQRVRSAFFEYVVQQRLRGGQPLPAQLLDPVRYHPTLGLLPEDDDDA